MQQQQNFSTATHLIQQCNAAMAQVSFPDLATRQLFETLVKSAVSTTARALGEQNIL